MFWKKLSAFVNPWNNAWHILSTQYICTERINDLEKWPIYWVWRFLSHPCYVWGSFFILSTRRFSSFTSWRLLEQYGPNEEVWVCQFPWKSKSLQYFHKALLPKFNHILESNSLHKQLTFNNEFISIETKEWNYGCSSCDLQVDFFRIFKSISMKFFHNISLFLF